jgi:NADH-quinone oxidoreductase subunit A
VVDCTSKVARHRPSGEGVLVQEYVGTLALLALVVLAAVALYGLGHLAAVSRAPLRAAPFSGGMLPTEHPLSRYHARWYSMTLVFLAFDLEMLFMYPWALVVAEFGVKAVVEMFGFLALLLIGLVYAWREGAFRWA